MVRVCQCKCGKAARNYYTKADYYLDRQELAGRWGGAAIGLLGLKPGGEVSKQPFELLCENRHPISGEKLTVRQKDKRTSGYDINFHCSKSVSLLYAMTSDPDILAAFRWAVGQTMRSMEARMRTRVRKGGQCFDRLVNNMAWAIFVHLTARPVLGVPDPHLHAHVFCFNAVFDPVERRYKAGQFREIKQHAPQFQALFRSLFARRLADLGFAVEWKGEDFEIAGFSPALLKKFSRRTQLIESEAVRRGVVTDTLKDQLGAQTREKKQSDATMPELRAGWWQRMTDDERQMIARAERHKRRPWPGDARRRQATHNNELGEVERRDQLIQRQRHAAYTRVCNAGKPAAKPQPAERKRFDALKRAKLSARPVSPPPQQRSAGHGR